MNDIVIFGGGGFGREVAWLIEDINAAKPSFRIRGFLDHAPCLIGTQLNGHTVFDPVPFLKSNPGISVAIAISSPHVRSAVADQLGSYALNYPNLIHPTANIGPHCTIGMGNIVCAAVIITVNVRMGSFCHLNLKTTLGHDCVVEDFTTTACGVDLAGNSRIGRGVYLGNHATVLQSVSVGESAVVGAGAVVNRDLPACTVSVGVPAKVIKKRGAAEPPASIPAALCRDIGFPHS
jgi:sugar O-acyltransferase (sialic acid O-acetyltransferase NeuD family)